jgi:hypothetical protein
MIHHLTECKTDKTVIQKIEWSNERVSDFQQTYKSGERAMQKIKIILLTYIQKGYKHKTKTKER